MSQENEKYKIDNKIRIISGVLGVTTILMLPLLFMLDIREYWFTLLSCVIGGTIFLYVAIRGKSHFLQDSQSWIDDKILRIIDRLNKRK